MNSLLLKVFADAPHASQGHVLFQGTTYPCALGRSGISPTSEKHEGDGATPAGTFFLRELWYRADRLSQPVCGLPTRIIQEQDGWCDDVALSEYNTHVSLPFSGSHENLWCEDEIYDVIVPLGYNDEHPIPGKGSAIFLHVARPGFTPTAGCVAMKREDLLEILSKTPSVSSPAIEISLSPASVA
ncbi:L,D-transpeptidase family protein [Patescibacteria group bacterium]|nr:L,D-transpeptidase family protein [Patescibacteria group bacterium]